MRRLGQVGAHLGCGAFHRLRKCVRAATLMIGSATLLLLAPIAKADLLTSSASSSINFGSVALDTTATDKFTVSIDPGYSLLGGTGSGINAPFSLAFGGCAGTSCTVDESYTATSLGASAVHWALMKPERRRGLCRGRYTAVRPRL
jgi:hypothetical protein